MKNIHAHMRLETPHQMPLLTKKKIKGRLKYDNINLARPVEFWKNVLWSDETILELFGLMYQWHFWSKKAEEHTPSL